MRIPELSMVVAIVVVVLTAVAGLSCGSVDAPKPDEPATCVLGQSQIDRCTL